MNNTNKKKQILITGGTGYLGSNIVHKLRDKFDFILIKRGTSSLSRLKDILQFLKIYDLEELNEELIKHLNIDIILHCATHYGRKNSKPTDIIEANLMLPLHLISLLSNAGKAVKFINTDTILDKNISVYSLSKSQFKEWMHWFADKGVYVNIQLEHFYGPEDDKTKFVSFLIDSFIKEVPFIDLTAGEQNRYFTYIDDVVSAFQYVLDNIDSLSLGFTEFQVSSDKPVNLKTFIYMVKEAASNERTVLNFGVIPYRNGELMDFRIDCSAIKNLGWEPITDLNQGLLKTIEIDKKHI